MDHRKFRLRALLAVSIILVTLLTFSFANAAEIFLDPDTVYIPEGSGEDLSLELKVDENTLGLRLFQVLINFDTTLVDTADTLAVTLGPLFESSGYPNYFGYQLEGDSALRVEALLLGSAAVVNGPGVVATINLRTADIGTANMAMLTHVMTDINNDTIPSTAQGATVHIATPPGEFELLEPQDGTNVSYYPGEDFDLVWNATSSVWPGDDVLYDLEYSKTADFNADSTIFVTGLSDTTYSLLVDDLREGSYYWRVTAYGDVSGFSTQSTPFPSWFVFTYTPVYPPDSFYAISPQGQTYTLPGDSVMFRWQSSSSPQPGEGITYTLDYSKTSAFLPESTVTVTDLMDTTFYAMSNDLRLGDYYWKVTAIGDVWGLQTTSANTASFDLDWSMVPTAPFALLQPATGDTIERYPGDSIVLLWEEAVSVYPDATVEYELDYSESQNFQPELTTTIGPLADTSCTVAVDSLDEGLVYWRVRSIDGYSGLEEESSPYPSSFELDLLAVAPDPFAILSPANESLVDVFGQGESSCDWQDATSSNPNDTITYVFYLGTDPDFAPGSELVVDSTVDISELAFSTEDLPVVEWLYMKVLARNRWNLTQWSDQPHSVMYFIRSDIDGNGTGPNVSDLVFLVTYMFSGGPAPPLMEAADINCDGSGSPDVSDLVYLVTYMFSGGPPPECL